MIKNKRKINSGSSLVEVMFYTALLAVLSTVVVNSMITMTRAFKQTTIQSQIVESGNIMEKISREIRQARGIITINANSLKLDTTESDGSSKTVEFSLSGSNLRLLENNVLVGNLNSPNIVVSGLTFTQIITTTGQAVKISFTVSSTQDSLSRTYNFYDTIVLRGDY